MQLLATQSLSSYIEQASELKDDLTHTQKQLLDTVNSLKEQNELNQRLLSDSLTFVQGSIQLLQPENKTYTKEASAKSKPRTLFDSKA
ncbi:flagellar protein [Bacillus sp. JCM 19045]|nr:flagellar protein [Bacillus sp. JCM 19045]